MKTALWFTVLFFIAAALAIAASNDQQPPAQQPAPRQLAGPAGGDPHEAVQLAFLQTCQELAHDQIANGQIDPKRFAERVEMAKQGRDALLAALHP
jgi:hypothetical protein